MRQPPRPEQQRHQRHEQQLHADEQRHDAEELADVDRGQRRRGQQQRRAERHRRLRAAPVGDAAGGEDRDVPGDLLHRGKQGEERPGAGVAARLGALRHQHVGIGAQRLSRGAQVLHLADERRAGRAHPFGKGRRIAEREHHRAGLEREREVEELRLLRQAPGDEADADARAARELELAADPLGDAVARADQAEAARVRHRGGERAAGHVAHGREDDGLLYAEPLGNHEITPCGRRGPCRSAP